MDVHFSEVRVRYAETDQGGVVYHSNYLYYFEVGRTEMLRDRGCPYAEIEAAGCALAVVDCRIAFKSPARYDDLLVVETRVVDVRRVRLAIATRILRKASGALLAEGEIVLAALDRSGRPRALPDTVLRLGRK